MMESLNGNHSSVSPPSLIPLRILIVGAGIGGLTAAVSLRQQGHNVEILEQSKLAQETGAAIHLAPNANGLLRRFGLYAEKIGGVECNGIVEFTPDGSLKYAIDLTQANKNWQHPWHLVHRAHLHSALQDLATADAGPGKPVKINLSSRVKAVDPFNATVTCENGVALQADAIIGADGVRSVTRKCISGGDLQPFESGKSAFRFLIPTELLSSDEGTKEFVAHDDRLTMWIGSDRRLVMYPCVNKTVMNFVAIHPTSETAAETAVGDWQEIGSKAKMLEVYEGFGAKIASILGKASDSKIKVWKLLDMAKMPSFVNGKLAVLGDAAHPFLPHQGQGGGQAIEDAASLAALLPLGTKPDEISERLRIYDKCRYERAHRIQEFTRLAGRDAKEFEAQGEKLNMSEYTAYNFGHDEWHASTHALQRHLQDRDGSLRYRSPFGFGPSPGPRQPLGLLPSDATIQAVRRSSPERFTRYRIRFRSSRTYLQNLLPPGFALTSLATVCSASISCTTLSDLTWLGGGGYSHLGLYIHGVEYTQRDGSKIHGTYIPVLFEDLTDPIITGRDEVGFPKVFASIDVQDHSDGYRIMLSWRGVTFGNFELKDLQKTPPPPSLPHVNGADKVDTASGRGPPPPPPEEGEFVYRYVPAVGEPGKADAEYVVFCPYPRESGAGDDGEKRTFNSASVSFEQRTWRELPTLHQISRALAEMPVYDIEEGVVQSGTGVGNLDKARRIE